jgi:hypothetical protein
MCVDYRKHSAQLALAIAMWSCGISPSACEEPIPPPPVLQNPPSSGATLAGFFSSKTPYEFWLTCLIGILGLAIIGALIFSLRKVANARPDDIARPVIILTVITGTLILVTVGYSNEQIAPAFGLFGTIIGYMLGRFAQSAAAPIPSGSQQDTASQSAGKRPNTEDVRSAA